MFRSVAIAAIVIVVIRAVLYAASLDPAPQSIGLDYRLYTDAARQWLETGQFYRERELAGPYEVMSSGELLYPPVMLWLFVPFTVLPLVLWVGIPVMLTLWAIYLMRPAWWAVALIATLSTTQVVQAPFLWGTPFIWISPAVAWGLLRGWPAAFVLVKPTFAAFVLAGMTRPRSLIFGFIALGVFVPAVRGALAGLGHGPPQLQPEHHIRLVAEPDHAPAGHRVAGEKARRECNPETDCSHAVDEGV